jgi:hypothetical protein
MGDSFVRDVIVGIVVAFLALVLLLIALPVIVPTGLSNEEVTLEQLMREANTGDIIAIDPKQFKRIVRVHVLKLFTYSKWSHVSMLMRGVGSTSPPTNGDGSDSSVDSRGGVYSPLWVVEIGNKGFTCVALDKWIKERQGKFDIAWRKLSYNPSLGDGQSGLLNMNDLIDSTIRLNRDHLSWFTDRYFGVSRRMSLADSHRMFCSEFVYQLLQKMGVVKSGKGSRSPFSVSPGEVFDLSSTSGLTEAYSYGPRRLLRGGAALLPPP